MFWPSDFVVSQSALSAAPDLLISFKNILFA
jgi:hypothetical protein